MKKVVNHGKRKGIRDIWWNAFMVKNCVCWSKGDIPECPTLREEIPVDLITWPEAIRIHNKLRKINPNYRHKSYICFYCDDYFF